jgi:hypothetical protein
MEESSKARKNGERLALMTAQSAASAVERTQKTVHKKHQPSNINNIKSAMPDGKFNSLGGFIEPVRSCRGFGTLKTKSCGFGASPENTRPSCAPGSIARPRTEA